MKPGGRGAGTGAGKPEEVRLVASHKRARFEYELLDELECGIALTGTEVKSLRQGHCSLAEAHAHMRGGELYLIGCHIPEYKQGNVHNHPPLRDRKLLLHRRELARWHKRVKERGVTIVPLSIYFKGSLVKVKLALGKGKRLYDKRESERKRSDQREMERARKR